VQQRGGVGSASRGRVDEALPPFSARRYIVIWLGFLAVMLGVIFALVLFNNGKPATDGTGNSVGASGGSANSGGSGANAGGNAAGGGAAPGVSCVPADAAPGKYMVIQTDKGCIAAKLHTEADAKVPNTIANFETKAKAGEFNGRSFHRVEDWVIQGGDPLGNGTGGGEMPSEYNQLPFKTGALGVARGPDPKLNNDSQFFIVKSDADYLNGQYTNFGQVVAGMDVVTKIAIGDKMNSVSVETK
jgi:cyclophilin family peptidyl-prolyl cis-trans isomerase